MRICYIKETENTCDIIKKIILMIKRWFNIIDIKKEDEKIFLYLPIVENYKLNKYKTTILSKKINNILYNMDIENVVLSQYLEKIDLLKVKLYCENINILDGRYLFKCLSYKSIKYILKKEKINSEAFGEVTILLNDINSIDKQNIIVIAQNIKQLNIVTNNIDRFKKIEEYLYYELGIVINISNNKKQSLLRSKIIINYDFPEEIINKYNINSNCIIINMFGKVNINNKKFNGININYYKINLPNKYYIKGFSKEIIYESLIYGKSNLQDIYKQVENDKIKIRYFIGNNGRIREKEFQKINE